VQRLGVLAEIVVIHSRDQCGVSTPKERTSVSEGRTASLVHTDLVSSMSCRFPSARYLV
jgi:hypothetical protein